MGRVPPLARPVRIGIVGKYVNLPDAYLSVVEALRHAGFQHGAKVDLDWIDGRDGARPLRADRLREPRRDRHPRRLRRAGHRGQGGRRRATPGTTTSPASGSASASR